ncbi:DUF3078 domain-containing protein [Bacteroidales bacterium OttesenSCG-928-K22]|nr:DUF3078 domain-containing protein [Bacteroidales bacterium OttesenSCG-928-K22]
MKKNLILTLAFLCLLNVSLFAQDATPDTTAAPKKWDLGLTTSINFSQVTFTNWAAGGDNSFSLNSFVNTFANYKNGKHNWDNSLQLGYGIINTKDQPLKKSDDKINLDSKYGWEINKLFRVTASLNAKTQFSSTYEYKDDGTANLVSNFMAPGYLTAGVGIDIVPLKWLSINVSPAVGKLTFVTIEELQVQYGNDLGQVCKPRFGGLIKIDMKKEVLKNVELASNLTLFTDYLDESSFDIAVNWDVFIIMKINKFLSANLTTNLIWDRDILTTDTNGDGVKDVAKAQFKELFGIGLTFSF